MHVLSQLRPVLATSDVALVDFLEAHKVLDPQEAHREVEQPWDRRGEVLLTSRPE